jgi:hypothetical protein
MKTSPLPDDGPPSELLPKVQEAPAQTAAQAAAEKRQAWIDHVSRTTAVLAVLAALSSGQYAGKFSSTILAQAEASDQWSYYQAKSIKKHLSESQLEIISVLAAARPDLAAPLGPLQEADRKNAQKYERELAGIKTQAEATEALKRKHQRQGDRFQFAFVVLQAGVVLSTIAASARRKELWLFAIAAGVAGLLMVMNGFLLVV